MRKTIHFQTLLILSIWPTHYCECISMAQQSCFERLFTEHSCLGYVFSTMHAVNKIAHKCKLHIWLVQQNEYPIILFLGWHSGVQKGNGRRNHGNETKVMIMFKPPNKFPFREANSPHVFLANEISYFNWQIGRDRGFN